MTFTLARRHSLRRLALGPALVLGLASATPVTAPAQSDALPDQIKQRNQELEAAREAQRKAAETQARLKREIAEIGDDRRRLNAQLIETAGKVRDVESRIAATRDRLKPLDAKEQALRDSLAQRRDVIADVLAALQRLGRRPPPALLVSPEDALQAVRSAILLGAVLPEMREQTTTLARQLGELVLVRKAISEQRKTLDQELASLTVERQRLDLLVEERQKKQTAAEQALAAERKRAADLADKASSLQDLISKLEQDLDASARAKREAAAKAKPDTGDRLAALSDPGRMAPAVAFAETRGRLALPVNGVKLRDYGAPDGVGGSEKGLMIATRSGAQVTAPCDGWVVYAGPFRSYGQLLILNAGGGYHVLLAGMDRISVDLGQFVLAGEPVAIMGGGSRLASVLTAGASQPVLYIEFRKDGTPIDPSPWWAHSEGEKARG